MKRIVGRVLGVMGLVWMLGVAAASAQTPSAAPPAAPKDTLLVGDWVTKTKFTLGLTQSAFSSNWTGDEVGSVAWLAGVDFLSDGQWKPSMRVTNSLILAFGQTHQQREDRSRWLAPLKSQDKIEYDGTLRFTLGKYVDPFVGLAFDSQFYQTFAGQTRVLNPMQFTESAGIAKPIYDTQSRYLVTRIGVAARQRYDYFAVAPLDRTSHDAGIEWRTVGRFATAEDKTVFKSELTVYQALFFSAEEAEFAVFGEDRWNTTDVRWQNLLSNKLNRWMSLELYFEYLFDEQLDKAGQFKQTMGVGATVQL
jgi:hypothetical protein